MDVLFGLPQKSQQEVAIVIPYMEICFLGIKHAAADKHVASYKTQKIDNVSDIIITMSQFHRLAYMLGMQ